MTNRREILTATVGTTLAGGFVSPANAILFGDIIDKEFADMMEKSKTPKSLARMAMKAKAKSQDDAIKKGNGMKEEFGDGISSILLVYNATGLPIERYKSNHYSGKFGKYTPDQRVENGQWSVFFHRKSGGTATGSIGSVVYKFKGGGWFVGWSNPYAGSNKAYCRAYQWQWLKKRSKGNSNWITDNGSDEGEKDNAWTRGIWATTQDSSPIFMFTLTRNDIGV